MEEWKIIPSHPTYAASNLGRIKRIAPDKFGRMLGYIMSSHKDRAGYPITTLTTNGKARTVRVNIMVCEAFHGRRLPKMEAAHKNGICDDNRAENLKWSTRKENEADKRQHGTVYGGDRHLAKKQGLNWALLQYNRKLTEDQVLAIYRDKRAGRLIAADYGVSVMAISRIRSGKAWTHITGA